MADDGMQEVGGLSAEFRLDGSGVTDEIARLRETIAAAAKRLSDLESQIGRVAGANGELAASQARVTSSIDASAAASAAYGRALDDVANMMLAMDAKEQSAAARAEARENARLEKAAAAYEREQARRDAAAEAAALKEAERQAKLVADYERDQARKDAAAEQAAVREAERQAKLVGDYERSELRRQTAKDKAFDDVANMMLAMDAKEEAAAARAEARENARLEKVAAAYEREQAKKDAAAEAAAIKDAERQAKLVESYERDQARRDAAAEALALKEAERQAKLVEAYERDQAKRDAAAEAFAIREAERQAKLLEAYERDEARKQAARDRANVDGGNFVIGNMTIQPDELQRLVAAEQADAIAKRQMANAAAGVAREQYHLNDVIRDGVLEMMVEQTAVLDVSAAAGAAGASMRKAAGAAGAMGQSHQEAMTRAAGLARGMMQLGYMVDDVQYGFQAVVNNTAPLVQSMAQAAGATAGVSNAFGAFAQIAAVVVYQVVSHWDKILGAFKEGITIGEIDGVDRIKDQLKEIEKAIEAAQKKGKVFTLAEKVEYDDNVKKAANLKQEVGEREAVDKVTGGKSKSEQAVASGFTEAVRESGGKAAFDELVKAFARDVADAGAAEEGMVAAGVPRAEAKKRAAAGVVVDAEDNAFRTPEEMARKEFSRAAGGDADARDRVRKTLETASESGVSEFAERIDKYSPETQKRMKANEERAQEETQLREKARRNEREAARKAEQDEKDRTRRINDEAAKAVPDQKSRTDRVMLKVERGEITEDEARSKIAAPLFGKEDSPLDASEAFDFARQEVERAKKDDPEKRAERVRKANLKDVEEARPNADGEAQAAVLRGMLTGRDEAGGFAEKLGKALQEKGMDADEAAAAAKEVVGNARDRVADRVGKLREDDGRGREPQKSEVYRSSDLTARIQGAISDRNDEPRKQTTLQERMVKSLETLEKQNTLKMTAD